jgi:hypothetical protein
MAAAERHGFRSGLFAARSGTVLKMTPRARSVLLAARSGSITITRDKNSWNCREFNVYLTGWSMPVTAECPFCAILIKSVPDEQDGQMMDCPRCGKPFKVAGRAQTGKDKKGGPSTQIKSQKAQYPTRKELDAQRQAEREAREREQADAAKTLPAIKVVKQRQSEPEEEEEETSSSGIPWFVILGVVAFLLGSIGLALASFGGMELVALGITFLGLVLAAIGFLVAFRQETGTLYPLLGILVCLPALLWSTYCYTQAPKPEKPRSAADLARKLTVPLNQRNAALTGETPIPAQQGDFVDFTKQAQQQGDLRVTITSASIAKAPLEGPAGKKLPTDKYLLVHLKVNNVGAERKYDFSGWGQWGSDHAASLRDTKGKTFKIKRFEAAWEIKGQVHSPVGILPGKSIDDILVFEAPPAKDIPAHMRLELPASAFGGEGVLQFEIPGKVVSVVP